MFMLTAGLCRLGEPSRSAVAMTCVRTAGLNWSGRLRLRLTVAAEAPAAHATPRIAIFIFY
jgi:hypothetical protein